MKRHEKEFGQYFEDWKTHHEPWKLWEYKRLEQVLLSPSMCDTRAYDTSSGKWSNWKQMQWSHTNLFGHPDYEFRRKPETIIPRGIDLLKPNLQWSKLNYSPMSWNDAVEFCENLEEGGFTDWRLPTIQELITLINFTKSEPASDLNLDGTHYWSSTPCASYTNHAWLVNFCYGHVGYGNKSKSYYVRAVRTVKANEGN